jgi:hypothetical protein
MKTAKTKLFDIVGYINNVRYLKLMNYKKRFLFVGIIYT